VQAIDGALGAEALYKRLSQGDRAAESELTAACLFRSRRQTAEVEFGPQIVLGSRRRCPDLRIRDGGAPWTYVEVTQLNRSTASDRAQGLLTRITNELIVLKRPIVLEIVFWREPLAAEEDELIRQACDACNSPDERRHDLAGLASLLVKSGNSAAVVPSILPPNAGTHMSIARTVGGSGEVNRQILVRVPFADQRAETILTSEARQLPKNESGLVMVDVTAQPTAFASWPELVPRRFSGRQHTRVGGVLLFMTAVRPTDSGMALLPHLNLIPNPHARVPLPAWITDVVEETRAETNRFTGRPD
jgi:hypothetical protein